VPEFRRQNDLAFRGHSSLHRRKISSYLPNVNCDHRSRQRNRSTSECYRFSVDGVAFLTVLRAIVRFRGPARALAVEGRAGVVRFFVFTD
jgi:hypothetical protein